VRINAQYPYVVQTVGVNPKTGEKMMYRSENLWLNPEPLLQGVKDIDVLIDPENPNIYMMDLSFFEQKFKEAVTP
jgi:hypothetical protein